MVSSHTIKILSLFVVTTIVLLSWNFWWSFISFLLTWNGFLDELLQNLHAFFNHFLNVLFHLLNYFSMLETDWQIWVQSAFNCTLPCTSAKATGLKWQQVQGYSVSSQNLSHRDSQSLTFCLASMVCSFTYSTICSIFIQSLQIWRESNKLK